VGGDQRGLPVAALRQFAIAGDDKYATGVVIAFRGHGLPVAVGIALAAKRDNNPRRVFVVTGDGELAA
jgi:transketolase N-terminal domain/subunit